MSKKLILYIGGFEMPDKNAAAQRVTANAKAFQDLGYETFFVGLSRNEDSINTISQYEGYEYINLKYPKSLFDWINYLLNIKWYYRYLAKKPEIVIAYNFPSLSLLRLRNWCTRNSIPIIADCTEWYEAKGNVIFKLIKGLDTHLRMRIVHPKLSGMIAISEYLFDFYKGRMSNVVKIPPLVDLCSEKWSNKIQDFNDKTPIIKFVYAGSAGKGNKDRLDVILKALSELKDEGSSNFHFNIIGITRAQFESVFRMSLSSNMDGNISFLGRIPHTEVLKIIRTSHFNLFLRDNNLTNRAGFPTKLVESISCGTPVITNSTSNISEYIVEGKNGFLLKGSSITCLKNELKSIINIPLEEVCNLKTWCLQSRTFDYKNFLPEFEKLLE